jgi:hypothetical protein
MDDTVEEWAARALEFQARVHDILSAHEASGSRVVNLKNSFKQMKGLSVRQEELLEEALNNVRCGSLKSAHVMSWAAFIDHLEEKLASDGLVKVNSAMAANQRKYQRAIGSATMDEIREKIKERDILDLAHETKLINGKEHAMLVGELTKRNQCGHPTSYKPSQNTTLGYVNGMMDWIDTIKGKSF